MLVTKKELENALGLIKENDHEGSAGRVAECLGSILDVMGEDGREYAHIIDRDEYIATILWQKDDIRAALQEKGIEPSDGNVQAVLNDIMVGDLENCERGWGVIADGIERVFGDSCIDGCNDSLSNAADTLDGLLGNDKAEGADATASNAQRSLGTGTGPLL